MKKTLLCLLSLLTFAPLLRAEETETAAPSLSTSLTLGYDSRYVLYGYRLSRHLYHADVYLYYPLDDKTSVWGGSWYGYLTDGTYHEVDVYAGIDRVLNDHLSVGFQYSLFNYLEVPFPASNQAHEFTLHATATCEPFSLSLRNQYDTEAEGSLVRAIATYRKPMCEKLSFSIAAEAGYALEYYIDGNLWNHALVTIKTPYQINDRFSVTPFIARSIPLAAIDDFEQYETYGGISASVSF